ncbi:MAG: hypothetical protein LUO79_07720 [Methanomassiliicoccales archaeon]|nr:hypothetical protein [Methanomassiliicoccales archaeon]
MKGWIIDCYPDYERGCMITWLKTEHGIERLVDRHFVPSFYVRASSDRMRRLTEDLRTIDVEDTELQLRTTLMDEALRPFLKVTVEDYGSFSQVAKLVDSWGRYRDYELYNVDLRFDQRYFIERGVFPNGLVDVDTSFHMLDSQERIDYPMPPLSSIQLRVDVEAARGIPTAEDAIVRARIDDVVIDGQEEDVIRGIMAMVAERDPDVVYTDGGDDFLMDYLVKRAELHGLRFDLGREKGFRKGKGKSYFTYGRILYKAPAHKLRGRIHIDSGGSFMYYESGLYGLIDLSRLCLIPVQDLSRLSPGSAISAMQVTQAMRDGHLVLWKKNLPEAFKTAGELLVSDRGGFIYEPVVGIHERIAEVDFTSLYPSIMVRHNISPETVDCGCCPASEKLVPELGYRICQRRLGLVPRVLRPIIERRIELKRLVKSNAPHKDIYDQRQKVLKWVLVTCFGYTGYRNARFGRIECHESINAYGRDILLRATEMAEERGFRILHGIVDSLWLEGGDDAQGFCDAVSKDVGIPLVLDGVYKWIVFLPATTTGVGALNRYYGLFEDGELKLRGIFLRKRDTIDLARELQDGMLAVFSKASGSEEFKALIPEALDVLDSFLTRLRERSVPMEKLVLTKRVSKELEEYTQFTHSYAAMKQMEEMGFSVPPGRSVEYVICDGESRNPWERVKVASFLDGSEEYDVQEYEDLLLRAAADLIVPFGWDFESLKARGRGRGPALT